MRILVLGGYGNFGARICRALSREGLEVIAAGRDPVRGHQRAGFDARIGKARLDMAGPGFGADLRALAPGIVIHCAGPYQGQDYRVAQASLAAGAHYIDLADGREFVADFGPALDSTAKQAGRLAVSGASTLPGLSSTVVDALKSRFTTLEEIQLAIAPAQKIPRGTATLKAVFSYLGRPFKWMQDGEWRIAYGWQELRRFEFASVGSRWAAACDVPDLELFPARYPGMRTVQFRAALEFGAEHFALAAVAGLRRMGVRLPLDRWAASIDAIARQFDRFGGERGGMLVRLTGISHDGRRIEADWNITALGDRGPEIPCMPAILIARKLALGRLTTMGAIPCMSLLSLDDFAPEFARWDMVTQVDERPAR